MWWQPDVRFDAVVGVDVLEHVVDLPRVLAEAARVLHLGGLFLFDTQDRKRFARTITVTLLRAGCFITARSGDVHHQG